MRSIKHRFMSIKKIGLYVLLICLNLFSVSCDTPQVNRTVSEISSWFGDRLESSVPSIVQLENTKHRLSEAAPPKTIRQLETSLALLSPRVSILEPQNDRVLKSTDINVRLQVENLPLFKDERWEIGPYLQLIVDNEPDKPIYNLDEPIVLKDLSPGTHTIRVFASRPWHESFKNEGAYAQTTFHVLTQTHNNNPSADLPLLTYHSPTGNYSAEPIMLDFYLANAPLHSVARENPDDEIQDWHVRVTVNGESFILEDWQSIYLKGFEPGKNWVQLELIDDRGNVIENVYNDTVRSIEYNPQNLELNTLDKLVSDRLSVTEVRSIVDRNYKIEPIILEPEIIENESTILEPKPSEVEPETVPEINTPASEETEPTANPSVESKPQPAVKIEVTPEIPQETEIESSVTETAETIEIKETEANPKTVIIEITQPENEKIDSEVTTITQPEATDTSSKRKLKVPEWLKNLWNKIERQITRLPQTFNNTN